MLINFDQITLNGKLADVVTLNNIGVEWIQNQTFLRLNQHRPHCKLAIKFDIAFIVSGTIICLVYITELFAWNKFLTNPSTTQWPFTKSLLANSRSTLFTRAGKATSRLKFVYSVMATHQESDKFLSTLNLNQNLLPRAINFKDEAESFFLIPIRNLLPCLSSWKPL